MDLSDRLYGNLVKILKILSIVSAIVVFFVFFITSIMYFTIGTTNGILNGLIYLVLAPVGGFIAGISLYALGRHFENQEKIIASLNEIKENKENKNE